MYNTKYVRRRDRIINPIHIHMLRRVCMYVPEELGLLFGNKTPMSALNRPQTLGVDKTCQYN